MQILYHKAGRAKAKDTLTLEELPDAALNLMRDLILTLAKDVPYELTRFNSGLWQKTGEFSDRVAKDHAAVVGKTEVINYSYWLIEWHLTISPCRKGTSRGAWR